MRTGDIWPLEVKLQRPLAGHNLDLVLIYDRERKHTAEVMMTPELRTAFGTRFKIFHKARREADAFVIGPKVSDRHW